VITEVLAKTLPTRKIIGSAGTPLRLHPDTGATTVTVTIPIAAGSRRLVADRATKRLYVQAIQFADAGLGCCPFQTTAHVIVELQ
jgi:hypothetical protein